MRMTEEEYRRLVGTPPKASKYHNTKIDYYDPDLMATITFDSKKEFEYYLILKDREKKGEIIGLKRQIPIIIQPEFIDKDGKKQRAITYIADFMYFDTDDDKDPDDHLHFVDVKGMRTEVYKLKKKLLAFRGVYIEEV